ALAAMQSIRRGWNVDDEPVQIDPRSQKMLFRASGRAGIAVVAEDSSGISMKLLEKERRSIRRVLQHDNVPVHQIVVGDGEGEVQAALLLASHEEAADQGRGRPGDQGAERDASLAAPVAPQGRGSDARPPEPQGDARSLTRPASVDSPLPPHAGGGCSLCCDPAALLVTVS